MVAIARIYDEVIDFLTALPKPEEVLNFRPSAKAQARLEDLLEKKRNSLLSEKEQHELEQYKTIEHLMRVAKAKAKKRLQTS
jgi:hypothetical protein